MKLSLKPVIYAIHFLLVGIVIFPLLFALVSSFRPLDDIFRYVSPISWRTFIPTSMTLEAYTNLFQLRGFGRVVFNTFFIAIVTVIFSIAINSMAAFAFAKFNFKGKIVIWALVMLSFMIPFEVISIPLYSLVNSMGWVDTYKGLIIPGIANGLVIFLFRQFFMDLPDSLLESARMEGASWWMIYTKIIMPLCKPVTISAGLLTFILQWESFMWPLIVTRSEEYRVIQVAISLATTEHATFWNEMFAATVLAVVVPVVLILVLQRYFVQGVASSGSKES
ncbi:carbohydrate ABC transporter permease [Paenibacillus validus]|uniref:ABC transporter permease subunit n=1 Tax=Paenibacillus validus TaxID=44253 RepID=A0A7X3CT21_9BACL|nr:MULTISPECIES: carbohydrate ABC transporter permease [Paenibacillus]MED4602067.1 carbohydrate ABC transporter permease [Paenibacillus validus]MED4607367.1 carbohydrate ABC transporter permease [Paenibacillus validus]MUG72370.1 ABC transporter permease subunit [Paenibacillus validus]